MQWQNNGVIDMNMKKVYRHSSVMKEIDELNDHILCLEAKAQEQVDEVHFLEVQQEIAEAESQIEYLTR